MIPAEETPERNGGGSSMAYIEDMSQTSQGMIPGEFVENVNPLHLMTTAPFKRLNYLQKSRKIDCMLSYYNNLRIIIISYS